MRTALLITSLVLAAGSLPDPARGQAAIGSVRPLAPTTDQLFPRPASLQPRIELWRRVYSEVPTSGGLLHDSEHLDVVYEVIELPETLSRRSRDRRLERAKDRHAAVLRTLATGSRTGLSAEEQRVLALWPPGVSNETLRAAARRIRFQRGQADRFRDGIIRSGRWEPHIRRVLADAGLPTQLAALPHVESSYNPRAQSHAGAAGLWQFTRSTGRLFLRIDYVVDERFDPFLATEAAAKLLRQNYEKTASWPLAITAYNHGSAGMLRAIRKLGTRDIGVIVDRYRSRSFGFASRNFYAEFLAALDVERGALRYFGTLARQPAADEDVVVTDAYYPASALTAALGVDAGLLQEFNLALRSAVWNGQKRVPKGYPLRVPHRTSPVVAADLFAAIPDSQRYAAQTRERTYKVRRGDTLGKIARRYRTTQRALMDLNGIRNRHRIRAGQILHLPDGRGTRTARAGRSVPVQPAWVGTSYRVRRGETLSDIARRVGVSTGELAAANGLVRPDRIVAGQTLVVPEPDGPRPTPTRYRVRRGDTLGLIARRLGVSLRSLAAANDLRHPYRINAGQILRIPSG